LFSFIHDKLFEIKEENVSRVALANGIANGDIMSYLNNLPNGTANVLVRRPKESTFTGVGNTGLCIPFGVLGGFVATAFYRRRPDRKAPEH
jgi:hypothetical protein